MKTLQNYLCVLAIALFTSGIVAQNSVTKNPVITKEYQGAVFSSEKSLVENLAVSDQFSYTQQILENPNLKELTASGSYTVFIAPDSFFNKMKEDDRDSFLASSNEYNQKRVFNAFIVPGRIDSRTLLHEIKKREGQPLYLKTLSGKNLGFKMKRNNMILFDADHQVKIMMPDFYHSKGFFHIVDGYFMPEEEE